MDEDKKLFIQIKGCTKLERIKFIQAIWYDNRLYLRFPKKGKRRLGRYRRHKKKIKVYARKLRGFVHDV